MVFFLLLFFGGIVELWNADDGVVEAGSEDEENESEKLDPTRGVPRLSDHGVVAKGVIQKDFDCPHLLV